MHESAHLAEALSGLLFEDENGWFLPAYQAMEGLSAEQAARSPGEKFNSPWAIVRHMSYWMEFILLRLRGEDTKAMLGEDWLPLPDPASESAWAADQQRLREVTGELAEAVRAWDETQREAPFSNNNHNHRHIIQGIIVHNCYHTNELICSRHMLGYWLEQT